MITDFFVLSGFFFVCSVLKSNELTDKKQGGNSGLGSIDKEKRTFCVTAESPF